MKLEEVIRIAEEHEKNELNFRISINTATLVLMVVAPSKNYIVIKEASKLGFCVLCSDFAPCSISGW